MNTLPPIAEMERAYLERDPAYNGLFFVGVRTTAIFCRPTCPARSPLPKNVEYFPTAAAALFAGYRPCKRCRPMAIDNQPEWAASLLADVERDPRSRITEGDLRRRGVDPATVRRHFLRHYGMTFQAYARARRLSRAFRSIRDGAPLDDAILTERLRVAQRVSRRVRADVRLPAGQECQPPLRLAGVDAHPAGPAGRRGHRRRHLPAGVHRPADAGGPVRDGRRRCSAGRSSWGRTRTWSGCRTSWPATSPAAADFSVPLVFPGTPFQRQVWEQLLEVPYGETRSYQELARPSATPRPCAPSAGPTA